MKNAFVLQHHHGDDGSVSEGMILMDISEKRFGELEKKDLVREATAKEVRDGYQPEFARDTSGDEAKVTTALDLAINAEVDRVVALRDAAHADHLRDLANHAAGEITQLKDAHAVVLKQAEDRAAKAEAALDAAQKEIEQLTNDAQKQQSQGDEKKAAEPANKKAAEPANKGA